jgi:hypothetical protein
MRYEVAPGIWKDTLRSGESFLRWVTYDGGPKETRAVRAELEKGAVPDAALDLHQDHHIPGQLMYGYVFGPRAAFRPLVEACARRIPVARQVQVDEQVHTDADGLIEFNDGSVTDYYWRRGVGYCAALETSTQTGLELAAEVNLIWIRGFIELAARAPERQPR